jgi:DNA-binding MarR family transcriptional regulator
MSIEGADRILDRFVDGVFRFLLDHHRTHVAEMELTLVQAQALRLLREAPASTTRLAASLGISAPAVSQLTDRLVLKELIERRAVPEDRRVVNVVLTEKGRRFVFRIRQRRNEVFLEVLARLNERDRAEVTDALGKVAAVLAEISGQDREDRKRLSREESESRTAVEPAQASKDVGQAPVSRPTRRMRIEWD